MDGNSIPFTQFRTAERSTIQRVSRLFPIVFNVSSSNRNSSLVISLRKIVGMILSPNRSPHDDCNLPRLTSRQFAALVNWSCLCSAVAESDLLVKYHGAPRKTVSGKRNDDRGDGEIAIEKITTILPTYARLMAKVAIAAEEFCSRYISCLKSILREQRRNLNIA